VLDDHGQHEVQAASVKSNMRLSALHMAELKEEQGYAAGVTWRQIESAIPARVSVQICVIYATKTNS
jgi:hypothetical protein